jgi:hypothetical protein
MFTCPLRPDLQLVAAFPLQEREAEAFMETWCADKGSGRSGCG